MITITRTYLDDATTGIMEFYNSDIKLVTIERPWLNNQNFVSCIPEGRYTVQPYNSPKHAEVWQIMNVENRQNCLFHSANFVRQLEGCVAPGLSAGYLLDNGINTRAVVQSVDAIQKMKEIIGYPSSFDLIIRSQYELSK